MFWERDRRGAADAIGRAAGPLRTQGPPLPSSPLHHPPPTTLPFVNHLHIFAARHQRNATLELALTCTTQLNQLSATDVGVSVDDIPDDSIGFMYAYEGTDFNVMMMLLPEGVVVPNHDHPEVIDPTLPPPFS